MKELKDKILAEGKVLSTEALDVSSFLNMQVDAELMDAIGRDFAQHYQDYDFDAFVTVESSGIAPSVFASLHANKPLVIIKKSHKLLNNRVQQPCHSFTKKVSYYLTVDASYIENKKVILLDDFLALGNVVTNVETLLKKANATLVSTGILISKNYQPGYQTLLEQGKDIYCQVGLSKLDPETNEIIFE